jgi:superfamily II DNA/RNA helicase
MDCLLLDRLLFSSRLVNPLRHIINDFVLISPQTRVAAQEIEKRMTAEGHTVVSLTGERDPSVRDAIIDQFRKGEAKVLIATNVLARGIDVSTVSMVINYVSSRFVFPEFHYCGLCV